MISRSFLNFNKEILFGEIGTLIGIQIVDIISFAFKVKVRLIPYLTVLGAIVFGSLFWLFTRVYDKSKEGRYTIKKLLQDMEYFTPASAILTFLIYYPTLFFGTKYFLRHNRRLEFSTITSQLIAFLLFITAINVYRYVLLKVTKKKL